MVAPGKLTGAFSNAQPPRSKPRRGNMAAKISDGVKRLLEAPNFAHLATLMPDGSPQVSTVWVDYDGKHILVNTAEARQKPRNVRRDPRVAEQHIDRMAQKDLGRSVYPFRQPGERRVIFKIEPDHVSTMATD
jgi:predicted pyridoxine 5'-phosphate oxidase superfamily flavin-nucleotide-binding protein